MAFLFNDLGAFENAFKSVSFQNWSPLRGNRNNLNLVNHRIRHNECRDLYQRKQYPKSPWHDHVPDYADFPLGCIAPVRPGSTRGCKEKPKHVPPPEKPPPEKPKPKKVPPPKKVEPLKSESSSSSSEFSEESEPEPSKYPEADDEFQKLKKLKPPVVMLYGQPVKGVEIVRERYLRSYAGKFKAVPIKMDEKIGEWAHLPLPETDPNILEMKKHDKSWKHKQQRLRLLEHAIELSSMLTSDLFSKLLMEETVELVKYAMLDSPRLPGGFIIDGFPGNLEEAMYYEPYFWEFVGGIQFMNDAHSTVMSTPPKYFRKAYEYKEKDIDEIVAHFGSKSIRAFCDDSWSHEDDEYMNSMLELYIQVNQTHPGIVPFSKVRKKTHKQTDSFVGIKAPTLKEIKALKEEIQVLKKKN